MYLTVGRGHARCAKLQVENHEPGLTLKVLTNVGWDGCIVARKNHAIVGVYWLPLSYSGNPGVNDESDKGQLETPGPGGKGGGLSTRTTVENSSPATVSPPPSL